MDIGSGFEIFAANFSCELEEVGGPINWSSGSVGSFDKKSLGTAGE